MLNRILSFFKRTKPVQPFQASTGGESVFMMGRSADALLKNPALDAALKKIEAEIFTAWKTSAPKDEAARERLYYRMEGIAQIRLKLQGMVSNMRIEEVKLKNNKGQS